MGSIFKTELSKKANKEGVLIMLIIMFAVILGLLFFLVMMRYLLFEGQPKNIAREKGRKINFVSLLFRSFPIVLILVISSVIFICFSKPVFVVSYTQDPPVLSMREWLRAFPESLTLTKKADNKYLAAGYKEYVKSVRTAQINDARGVFNKFRDTMGSINKFSAVIISDYYKLMTAFTYSSLFAFHPYYYPQSDQWILYDSYSTGAKHTAPIIYYLAQTMFFIILLLCLLLLITPAYVIYRIVRVAFILLRPYIPSLLITITSFLRILKNKYLSLKEL